MSLMTYPCTGDIFKHMGTILVQELEDSLSNFLLTLSLVVLEQNTVPNIVPRMHVGVLHGSLHHHCVWVSECEVHCKSAFEKGAI